MWVLGAAICWPPPGSRWLVWRRGAQARMRGSTGGADRALVWLMQTALAALLLFLLWHPALSVATLKPQQNIVAVVVDDSGSMALADEGGSTRRDAAVHVLELRSDQAVAGESFRSAFTA